MLERGSLRPGEQARSVHPCLFVGMSDARNSDEVPSGGAERGGQIPAATASASSTAGDVQVGGDSMSGGPRARTLFEQIEDLKKAQQRAREAKKKASMDLRNAVEKKQRVMKKARELSNSDLVEVIALREEAAALRAQKRKEADDPPQREEPSKSGASSSGSKTVKKQKE